MKYHQTPSYFVNQQQLHQNEGGATTHRLVLGRPTPEAPAPDSVPTHEVREAQEPKIMAQEQVETPVPNTIVVVQIEKETPHPTHDTQWMQEKREEKEEVERGSTRRAVAPASHSKPPYLWDPRSHPRHSSKEPKSRDGSGFPEYSDPSTASIDNFTKKTEKTFERRTTETREVRSECEMKSTKILPSTSGQEDEGRGAKGPKPYNTSGPLRTSSPPSEPPMRGQARLAKAHHGVTSPLLWGSAGLGGKHGSKSPSPTGGEEGECQCRSLSKSPSPIEELFWRATAVSTRWDWEDLWTTFSEAPGG